MTRSDVCSDPRRKHTDAPQEESTLGAGLASEGKSMTPSEGTATWQDKVIEWAARVAAGDPEITDVFVGGSFADRKSVDAWSDVDLAVIAAPAALARVASPDWVASLGPVWAWDRSGGGDRLTFRAVFYDGRRVDIIAAISPALVGLAGRSLSSSNQLNPTTPRRHEIPDLHAMANSFRFGAALAVVKVARDDLLIGAHLTLQLLSDCLVLEILLRDLDSRSDHQRADGPRNDIPPRTHAATPSAFSAQSLLGAIKRAAVLFDELAKELDPTYDGDMAPLDSLAEAASSTR